MEVCRLEQAVLGGLAPSDGLIKGDTPEATMDYYWSIEVAANWL